MLEEAHHCPCQPLANRHRLLHILKGAGVGQVKQA